MVSAGVGAFRLRSEATDSVCPRDPLAPAFGEFMDKYSIHEGLRPFYRPDEEGESLGYRFASPATYVGPIAHKWSQSALLGTSGR